MDEALDRLAGRLDALYEQRSIEKKALEAFGLLHNARIFAVYLLFFSAFAVFLLFVLLFLAAPLLIQSENPTLLGLGAVAYNTVSVFMMCHQLPMRSFFIAGVQQAVCARDAGIYSGIAFAGIMFLIRKPGLFKTKKFFLLTLVPIMLDGVTQTLLNLRESSNMLRLATGFIFGFGLMFFVLVRIKRLNTPEFSQTVSSRLFLCSAAAALVAAAAVLSYAGSLAGGYYVSRGEAVTLALNSTSETAATYYIPPRTPFSFYFYPNKDLYSDYVLSDLAAMPWVESQIQMFYADPLENQSNLFDFSVELKHYHGMWVVVDPSTKEGESMQAKAVFTHASGKYYYVDALSGEVFASAEH